MGRAGRLAYAREGADVLISYLSAHLDAADPGDHAGGQVGSSGAETLVGRAGQPAELAPA
jgi:hypothetical protein